MNVLSGLGFGIVKIVACVACSAYGWPWGVVSALACVAVFLGIVWAIDKYL